MKELKKGESWRLGYQTAMTELKQYADDWVEAMWNIDVLPHDAWDDGVEEAQSSLRGYLEGSHKKYPVKEKSNH